MAPDLDVALFEDVEQADLDALGEVGQLVDRENAAVDTRDEAVVQRELVAEVAALGDLDRVDLADEVGDRGVGRRQFLAVALRAVHPGDGRGLAELLEPVERETRDGVVGVVVDLGALDDRHPLVEQADQGTDDARLGLAALAQEDDVMPRQDGVLQLGHDRLFEAEDAGGERRTGGDRLLCVAAHLRGDRDRLPARGAQVGQRGREVARRLQATGRWRRGGIERRRARHGRSLNPESLVRSGGGRCVGGDLARYAISTSSRRNRSRTRPSMSSRMGRTPARAMSAGSATSQSS